MSELYNYLIINLYNNWIDYEMSLFKQMPV